MEEIKDTEAAFRWIVGLLKKHQIPYQIFGGFAARLYGSMRPLADIDIGIPDDKIKILYADVKEFVSFGPARYLDDEWDLNLMTLIYKGQEIDIGGEDEVKIFDNDKNAWISASHDLSKFETKEIYGLSIPVVPKEDLIEYKKKLGREVDILDVEAMLAS